MRAVGVAASFVMAAIAGAQSDPAVALRVPNDSASQRVRTIALATIPADSASPSRTAMPQWCTEGRRGRRVAQGAVAATFVGGNLALYEYFRRAWWSGERAPFHLNYDWNGYYRDQDKLGQASPA